MSLQEIGDIDDENELEIEINEEEIVYPAEEGGKGKRTVVKRVSNYLLLLTFLTLSFSKERISK